MTVSRDTLYALLPAVYRVRDASEGEPLRALFAILAEQGRNVEQDIATLYDNWFIETCEEWVVPYLGDLVGLKGLHPIHAPGFSQRARTANVLRYRRRKGTATMLEQLARDTTGWNARAVEFFERLGWTQHVQHLRPDSMRTPDLRQVDTLELLGGPFERAAHTVDVRRIASDRGRYNIMNVGLFLWRLQSYYLAGVSARAVGADAEDGLYTFNPAGVDAPLFNRPRTETEIAHLADEINVPTPLRRRPLYQELETRRQALADGTLTWGFDAMSFAKLRSDGVPDAIVDLLEPPLGGEIYDDIVAFRGALADLLAEEPARELVEPQLLARAARGLGGEYFAEQSVFEIRVRQGADAPLLRIPPEEILICDMGDAWRRPPATKPYVPASGGEAVERPIRVAVDPATGRIAFREDEAPESVIVAFAAGFSGDLGGGPYNRRESLPALLTQPPMWQLGVSQEQAPVDGEIVSTITEAIAEWNELPPETTGLITLLDSRTYEEDLVGNDNQIKLAAGSRLVIMAAGWPAPRNLGRIEPDDRRPHILGDITVQAAAGTQLALDGLLIEGNVRIESAGDEGLRALSMSHCTLVPGESTLWLASDDPNFAVDVRRSICPGVAIPPESAATLTVVESVIDEAGGVAIEATGATLVLEGCTVFGDVAVRCIEGDASIITGAIDAARQQSGCVRFSYVVPESRTPRRFRCQPDLAVSKASDAGAAAVRVRVTPAFTSIEWGEPGYAQLAPNCPVEIRTGAEDGSEMGVFGFLKQPQREANLRSSLDEYLRIGLEAGLIFVT